ncbi:peptidoglycan-binding domain-containing protein [Trueperella bialowiezensis]|uniref:Peptidoglycan binding-like domain-containing protein n=1 Tax=Trueperella bialowiezensis TaxID=312285 RepID=A0A3S4VA87_9ACTO|nr:peptidoglycan-binding domain-containing protein [Trueperella bialowiezensis]VEI13046.1 Uncharacterised protein [Trueperella bialowiezensis]
MKNRYLTVVGLGGAVLLLIVTAFGLGRWTMHEAMEAGSPTAETVEGEMYWTVKPEQIGRTINYSATISSRMVDGPLVHNDGVITAILGSGDTLNEGAPILEVNLKTIVVGQGNIPAFRDLVEGEAGADVQQLRDFLCRNGYGVCAENEVFTPAMSKAVRAWQKTLGNAETGIVLKGDIMWFSKAPVYVHVNKDIAVGSAVTATDRPIMIRSGEPYVEIKASEEQLAIIPSGSPFTLEGKLSGVVGEFTPTFSSTGEADGYVAPLLSEDGAESICHEEPLCEELLAGQESVIANIDIQTIPQQEGLGVPTTAVMSSADGSTYVTLSDGERKSVTVLASAGGISLVEGLVEGDLIRLTGEASSTPESTRSARSGKTESEDLVGEDGLVADETE